MKNILGEEAKYNILIRTKPEKIEHKMQDVIDTRNKTLPDDKKEGSWCYWTVSKPPTREGILDVLFTDSVHVFAEGNFYGTAEDAIEFSALKRVNYLQPKKAPTRGFTYVEIDEFGRTKPKEKHQHK